MVHNFWTSTHIHLEFINLPLETKLENALEKEKGHWPTIRPSSLSGSRGSGHARSRSAHQVAHGEELARACPFCKRGLVLLQIQTTPCNTVPLVSSFAQSTLEIPRLHNGQVLDVPVRVGTALTGIARPRRPTEAHNDASTRPTWTSGPTRKSRRRRHVQRCTNPTYPRRWRIRVAARVLR